MSFIKYGKDTKNRPTLWGCAGGQLEFVSMRMDWRQRQNEDAWYPVTIIRFTDHDAQIDDQFYELEFPVFSP
jgi:hypothetical protein